MINTFFKVEPESVQSPRPVEDKKEEPKEFVYKMDKIDGSEVIIRTNFDMRVK